MLGEKDNGIRGRRRTAGSARGSGPAPRRGRVAQRRGFGGRRLVAHWWPWRGREPGSIHAARYSIEDLDTIGYTGPREATLAIQVHPATADVPAAAALVAQHGQGSYFATTEGVNWQDDWAPQRPDHPYVVVITGFLTFAQQPW